MLIHISAAFCQFNAHSITSFTFLLTPHALTEPVILKFAYKISLPTSRASPYQMLAGKMLLLTHEAINSVLLEAKLYCYDLLLIFWAIISKSSQLELSTLTWCYLI